MADADGAVRVRVARSADDAALAGLDAVAWTPESGFPSVQKRGGGTFFTEGSPPEAHLVAEVGDRVVGYIRLKPITDLPENAHVLGVAGLAVAPDARGAGVGAALLAAAEQSARARGARKLSLRVFSTNGNALRLYRRQGFAVEGTLREEFCVNGRYIDDVIMAKALDGTA